MPADNVAATYKVPAAGFVGLIDDGLVKANFARRTGKNQVARRIDSQFFARRRTVNSKDNGSRVGTGFDYEIIFELPLITVIDQINAVINVCILDPGVSRDIRAPLGRIAPEEVIAHTRQLIYTANTDLGMRTNQFKADVDGPAIRRFHSQQSFIGK